MSMEHKAPLTLVKSPRDERDWHYGSIVAAQEKLPARMSMREQSGPIRAQGEAGFCHSFAGTALKNLQETQEWGAREFDFSPLALARAVKARDGIVHTEGSTLLDVCKALCEEGVFDEAFYPYDQYQAGSLLFPPMQTEDLPNLPRYFCKNYARLDTLEDLKQALARRKPVLLGITCGEGIRKPEGGCVGLPFGEFIIGGHGVLVIGYDDEKEATIKGRHYRGFLECQNSWGEQYGEGGYFWLPYAYLTYRTKDFGMSFLMDMYTTVDLEQEELAGTALELFLGSKTAYDDGKEIHLEQEPIADERTGRTLVPLRFVGEGLGCDVRWNAAERSILIQREERYIRLKIGSEIAEVDGREQRIEQAPILDARTGRTLIPLRFVAQTLGNPVLWDGRRRKIIILKK